MYEIYQVTENKTLEEIGNDLEISSEELSKINGYDKQKYFETGNYVIIPKRQNNRFINYIIQNGDTIYAIANKYNLDYKQLLDLNGLDKEEYIYPGQEIIVPNDDTLFWVTGENDTLDIILNKLGLTIEEFIDLNDKIYLKPEQLFIAKKKIN